MSTKYRHTSTAVTFETEEGSLPIGEVVGKFTFPGSIVEDARIPLEKFGPAISQNENWQVEGPQGGVN